MTITDFSVNRASNTGRADFRGAVLNYSLRDIVWKNLTHEMIDLPKDQITEDERRSLTESRPQWTIELAMMNRRWRDNTWF
jgi:hypothetical protein